MNYFPSWWIFLANIASVVSKYFMTVASYLPALHVQKDKTATKQTKELKTSSLIFWDVIFIFAKQNKELRLPYKCLLNYLFPEKDNTYNLWHNFAKNPVKHYYVTNLFPSRTNVFCFEKCDWLKVCTVLWLEFLFV